MKFKIGITCRISSAENYNEKRDLLAFDWADYLHSFKDQLQWCMIPNSISSLSEFLNDWKLDGFILSGGDDINFRSKRDILERQIISNAIRKKMPLLGVCRGAQIISSYYGCSLKTSIDHVGINHNLILSEKAQSMFEVDTLEVNSFHKNVISNDQFSRRLEKFAQDEEGNIEMFKVIDNPMWGIMWHPERVGPDLQKKVNNRIIRELFCR